MTTSPVTRLGRTDMQLSGDPSNGLVRTALGAWSREVSGPSARVTRTANVDLTGGLMTQFNSIEWTQGGVTLDTGPTGITFSKLTAPRRGLYAFGATLIFDPADVAVDTGIGARIVLSDDQNQQIVVAADGILGVGTPPSAGYALNPHGFVWLEPGDGLSWQPDGDSLTGTTTLWAGSHMWMHWMGDYADAPAATTDSLVDVTMGPDGALGAAPRLAGATTCGPSGLRSRTNRAYHCTVDKRYYTNNVVGVLAVPWDRQLDGADGMWDPSLPDRIKLPVEGYWLLAACAMETQASNVLQISVNHGLPSVGALMQAYSDCGLQHKGHRSAVGIARTPGTAAYALVTIGQSAVNLSTVNGARGPGFFLQATWLGPLT